MQEIICHLHAHSAYSDGALYHAEIARAAAQAGVDVVWLTDHNVRVTGVDGWRACDGRNVLLLAAEEIHQQDRIPQKNHLLVYGVPAELAAHAGRPQALLDAVQAAGGVCFLAHPTDPESRLVGEPDLSWVDWDVRGFTGIEIWNFMSEFKSRLQNPLALLWYLFFPSTAIRGPFPQTLTMWDRLLASGMHVAGIGSSDAHGAVHAAGPLRRTVFPYRFLFGTVNTHLLLPQPLAVDPVQASAAIVECLRAGRGWVGYDYSRSMRGFQYFAEDGGQRIEMGAQAAWREGITLRASLPAPATLRLVRAGSGVVWHGRGDRMAYRVSQPGVYRLEASRFFRGRLRGWIFSNPIYLMD